MVTKPKTMEGGKTTAYYLPAELVLAVKRAAVAKSVVEERTVSASDFVREVLSREVMKKEEKNAD